MHNRLSVARCCCGCMNCCNGTAPTEWDVAVNLVDDTCSVCDSVLSGPFTLQYSPSGCGIDMPETSPASCKWGYCHDYNPTFNSVFCNTAAQLCWSAGDPFDCWVMGYQYMTFSVTCISSTKYALSGWMKLEAWNPNYFVIKQTINWYEEVDFDTWNCGAVSDYCIPFLSSSMFYNYPGWGGPYWQLCDASGSTFCVTAVP